MARPCLRPLPLPCLPDPPTNSGAAGAAPVFQEAMMFDLLIQNAQVLDGTGAPGFTADVAVKDGKIAAVGKLSGEAAETVDGTGLTLAPGFIDVYGYSDLFMALDPARASKLLQGVTTELCGQCGLGPAPVSEQNFPLYRKYLSQQGVPMYPDNQDFTSFSAYLERMEKTKAGIHLAYFIPHGTVRMAVMGFSPAAPDKTQLEPQALLRALTEKDALARLASLLLQGSSAQSADAAEACGLDRLLISNATKTPEATGKTIAQLAQARGISAFEAYTALLLENELGVQYIKFGMSEADVSYLMSDPLCMFGSNALYVPGLNMTHPRSIGTFPCILRRSVREERSISLAEAVRKLTSLPAEVYGLREKGLIRPGMDADLVLFDAERITDHATYAEPLLPNEGICRVYVDGVCAVRDDQYTGAMAGTLLRRSR